MKKQILFTAILAVTCAGEVFSQKTNERQGKSCKPPLVMQIPPAPPAPPLPPSEANVMNEEVPLPPLPPEPPAIPLPTTAPSTEMEI